jgi:uncharacterized protein (DUF2141 family)
MRVLLPLLLMFGFINAAPPPPNNGPEVEVELKNIKTPKGVFVISFYNDEKAFPKPGKEALTEKINVHDTLPHTYKFKLPSEGWYAIAMFQDEDETGKIKQDKIGIPLEAYAFSNNIHPKTGPPSFASCKFYATVSKCAKVAINLIQPFFQKKKK